MAEVLKEVKKGETGYGLLIENDGYASLDDTRNSIISEDIETKKENGDFHCPYPFIVNAIFQKYDTVNANGRVYPEGILKREVAKYQKNIQERMAIGEADHPADSTIAIRNHAINIIELHWENKTLVGKLEVITSPGYRKYGIISCEGDKVANMLLSGLKIGVSSRAVGSVTSKNSISYVGDDLDILGWDCVCTPSTPGAYISENPSELERYIESEQHNGKQSLMEDISKFDQWLND